MSCKKQTCNKFETNYKKSEQVFLKFIISRRNNVAMIFKNGNDKEDESDHIIIFPKDKFV